MVVRMDKTPKISVVIATKNRFHDIIKCIESILVQALLPDELVIVDSSDTTELKSKLDIPQNKIAFKYIHAMLSLTQARNVGIRGSTGDIIVFLDDDVILDNDYIKEMMHVFNNDLEKKVGGVTGNIINTEIKNHSFKHLIGSNIMHILATIFFLFKYSDGKFQPSGWPTFTRSDKITRVECLSGANMAFRKEIFNEFKFDENLRGYSFMEDDDIAYRVSRKYQNVYTPFEKLIHNTSPTARDKKYARMKMTIENHYYLFKKNFPQGFKHKFAFWWSVVGLFAMTMVNGNKEGMKGLMSGILNIKRNQNRIRR
jgi:glycosyltransferase involved in cell wall biosynthesis